MCRLLGRSCNLFLRCAVTTAEPPQLWYMYAYRTPPTAGQLSVEHLLAIFTRRSDLRRVIRTCTEIWPEQPPRVVVCDAGEAALYNSGRYTPWDKVHAEGPTSIRQGAPENDDQTRALSLRGCTHRVPDGSYTDRAIAAVCGVVWAAKPVARAERARPVLS